MMLRSQITKYLLIPVCTAVIGSTTVVAVDGLPDTPPETHDTRVSPLILASLSADERGADVKTPIADPAVMEVGIDGHSVTASSSPPPGPTLELIIAQGSQPVQPGDEVIVRLRMRDLGQWEAAGFQAFLEYDPDRLELKAAIYTSEPFGLHVLDPIDSINATIDLAAGIDIFDGQTPTSDAADLVLFVFTTNETDCLTSLHFRENDPPTRLTDSSGADVQPLELVSLPMEQPSADLDGDGVVGVFDLLQLLDAWGPCPGDAPCPEDLNCDNVVDVFDLLTLLENWG